jgi:hypothetical protein
MSEIFIFFINYYQTENFVVCYFIFFVQKSFIYLLEQYSLSHELRFQYINHADTIKVSKIDDVKEMRDTQVYHFCNLFIFTTNIFPF